MNLTAFEHQFIRTYKQDLGSQYGERKFLIAVSGGADSVACLRLFHQFQNLFQYQFRVAHIHHGLTDDSKQQQFRDDTALWVKELCAQLNVELVCNVGADPVPDKNITDSSDGGHDSQPSHNDAQNGGNPNSEQQLRKLRYGFFNQWLKPGEILVLGHHLEDLLETQLMDLLRGTHFHHWAHLQSYHEGKFRPLCQCGKKDIVEYLEKQSQDYIEDPSNADVKITRNWMRHELLNALEQRFPGAKLSLSKNLKKLYEYEAKFDVLDNVPTTHEISLLKWMLFSYSQKQKFVLGSHLSLAEKSLTQGQIEEVIKHLDQRQKDIKFQTGPIFWMKNAEKIYARRENI